jgi:hypothetical protein
MDPDLLALLLGGMPSGISGPVPTFAAPPVIPAMPAPALVGDSFGPLAPMVPAQTLEPTNIPMQRPAPPQEAYRSEMPSLGASLEGPSGVPLPRPRPTDVSAAAAPAAGGGDALLKTLQGVKAPAPPAAQKVSTPNLPALRPIQAGGFAELLASLGIGPQQAMAGMKLPSTLGQALGGR